MKNLYLATFSHSSADPTTMAGIVSFGTIGAENIAKAYVAALPFCGPGLKLAVYTMTQAGRTNVEGVARFALLESIKVPNMGQLPVEVTA